MFDQTEGLDSWAIFWQGMLQAWNFNQPEALRAFQLASEEDPAAAMPFWGQAYALGPGANRCIHQLNQPILPCLLGDMLCFIVRSFSSEDGLIMGDSSNAC